ncbi:UNVERIFIED_CONTAM: Metal-nicotianamine transporter YSL1 [Sesamum angustifolium]|uniref:Metal-nicotianamine transporter YSL1 n=1 Tax=Sesamum angustifolium TaxID=2727405 RepID=A0AAW2JLC2_9LAMI
MKLNLTTGITPNLNVSAALLAFIFIRTWNKLIQKTGIVSAPFTKQENTMIQTCVVACYSIAVGGGFGSYLLGMNKKTFELSGGTSIEGNTPSSIKEPGIGWMTGFLFLVCFVGLFVLIPLRKEASKGFHQELFFQFPVGIFPVVLHSKRGLWFLTVSDFRTSSKEADEKLKEIVFPADIPESSMKSLNGYKYLSRLPSFWVMGSTILSRYYASQSLMFTAAGVNGDKALSDRRKDEVFIRESIPLWIGAVGYIILSMISVVVIPFIFPELKWYFVLVAYIFAPSLAFCNAYGVGLTDINMAYNYGKVGLFTIAAMSGKEHGVIAALAACGLFKSIINVASILMQDLKTGHLTLTSPRAMLLSQALGTALGCIVSPLSFFLFYKAFDIGNPDGEFKAPYAIIYRNLAIIGVQGFSALPQHCLQLCYGFFAFAIAINFLKDFSPKRIGKWMPIPTAMAVPFLIGGYFAIDMCVGSLVVFLWQKVNSKKAELMVPAVASGFICGEGLWTIPASILALAKITPPICMKFLPG